MILRRRTFHKDGGSVTEGEDIVFIITRDLMTDIETAVKISFESTGDFFKTIPLTTQVSFPEGVALSTAKITISTVDDKDIEADGSLMASIVIIPGSPLRPGTPDERIVTILNDDVPAVISFERAEYDISEGTTGTITLLADPPPGIKTRIELTADSATILNSEYRLSTTIITFAPDQSTASFEVSIFDDDIVRSTRELSLSFDPLDDKTATRGTVSETVISVGNNDESSASLEVVGVTEDDIRLGEGDNVTLRVALDLAFDRATSIQIVIAGTATTEDYTIDDNLVMFTSGSTSAETSLTVIDDGQVEPNETIILTLEANNNEQIRDGAQLTLTIEDNDVSAISFERAGYDISEGTTGTVILVAEPPPGVEAQIRLTADSATILNSEYSLSTTMITFEPGQSTASFVVEIFDDDIVRSTRELSLSFEPLNATRGATSETVISVGNNDVSTASLEIVGVAGDDIRLEEGDNATLRVTLDLAFDRETTIQIVIAGTATTDDYTIADNLVMLSAGSTYAERTLTIIDDGQVEPEETIILALDAGNNEQIIIGNESGATLTIEDNDVPAISFERDVYTIFEGTTGTITLLADPRPLVKIQIRLTTLSETTISDDEYRLSTTIITFESDQSTASFEVSIPAREDFQATRELHLSFELLDTENSTPGAFFETVINVEDDSAPIASLEVVGDDTLPEGGGSATLRVTLDRSFEQATSIRIVATGTATPGDDYTINGNLLELPRGSTSVETTLEVIDDFQVESAETIILTLNAHNNRIIDNLPRAQLTLTIEDNDVPAAISFERDVYDISEGTIGTITLLADPSPKVKTQISLTADSATILNSEYSLSTTMIVFEPGQSTASFEVEIIDDDVVQSTRTLSLSINPVDNNATRGATSETVIRVRDSDVSSASLEVVGDDIRLEEGGSVTLRVTLDLAFDRETTIQIVATGDATPGDDYTINRNLVELRAGSTYVETILEVMDDGQVEPDETIILTLEANNNEQIRDGAQLTLTIADNDVPAISFERAEYTISEGTTDTVTLVADQPPVVNTRIRLTTTTTTFSRVIAEDDYEILPGDDVLGERDILFRSGESTASFVVKILDDDIVQSTRELSLSFDPLNKSATRGTISETVISIGNNDVSSASLEVVGDDIRFEEGANVTLRVTLDLAFDRETSIQIVIAGGTATTDDYRINVDPIELPADSTYAERTLTIIDDDQVEPDETIILALDAGNNEQIIIGDESSATLTIEDNDVPAAISFERDVYDISEGTTGTITLVAEPSVVEYTAIRLTADSATILNSEYSLSTTMITFEPGQSTASFEVSIFDDDIVQSTRELSLSFEVPDNNATRGATSETVISVGNNDVSNASLEVVGVAGDDIRLEEGSNVTLRVTLDLAFDRATSIQIVIAGTATTDDYRINVDPIELPADSTYAERTLTIIDDDQVEPDETIILALDAGNNEQIIIGNESGVTLTIDDNDVPAISFERAEYTIFEGTTGTVTLVAEPSVVEYTAIRLTADSATILNSEYSLSTTMIVFGPGQSTASFEVSIFDDNVVQSTRELSLSFEVPDNNATRGATSETVISVGNNDVSNASLEVVGDDTRLEEGGSATLRVTLDLAFDRETSIQIVIAGGTATTDDYRINVDPVELPAGSTYAERTLTIIDDGQVEPEETIILALDAGNNEQIIIGNESSVTLTIEDNDVPAISFERDVYTIFEGTTGTITLLADPRPLVKIQIRLTTLSETTISDDDYALSTTIITFESDQSTASFEVSIPAREDFQETRELHLSFELLDTENSTPGAVFETMINVEDDSAPIASLEVVGDDILLEEGDSVTLRVTLDRSFEQATSIRIVATGTATPGDDYTINGNLLELPRGSTYAETTLEVSDDFQVELDETIILMLAADNNRIIDNLPRAQLTLTIEDNDVPAAISFERDVYDISEGTIGTITLLADPSPKVKTQISLTADSATILNSEYSLSTTMIVFEPGQSTASFEVSIFDDNVVQSTRTLSLSINPVDNNATRGATSETVISVGNNDVSSASLEVVGVVGDDIRLEEGGSVTLRVTLDLAFDRETTIQIVATGDATPGDDYTINRNLVELTAGSTYVETILEVMDDGQVEPDETIILTLEADNEQIIIDDESGVTLTLEDNDVPAAISFERAEYTIFEGTIGTITLLADPPPGIKTQISLTTLSETTVSDEEYRLSTTIITFEPGQSTASFVVEIFDDDVVQSTRTLSLSINPVDNNATRGATSKTVIRVRDNNMSIASLEVVGVVGDDIRLEEGGSATLRVTLDLAFDRATSIQIVIAGTATTDDYRINVDPIELPAGSTYAERTLTIIDDDQVEPDETIILVLDAGNNGQIIIGDESGVTLTIDDNDVPAISFERAEYTIFEGTTGTVTLVAEPSVVEYTAIRLTADSATILNSEYSLSTTIIVFEPGQSTASFVVEIFDDDIVQSTRELSLSFEVPDNNATRGATSETVISVGNNDVSNASLEVVGVAGNDIRLGEGANVTLRVTLDLAFDRATSIQIVIAGTATTDDYRINVDPIELPADSTYAERTLTIIDDDQVEPDETIILVLDAGNNGQIIIGDESGVTLTIDDNDVPAISFERAEYTISEGTTGTVTLVAEPSVVEYTAIRLTADSATILNSEYSLSTTIIVFEPGQSTASFVVEIFDDDIVQSTRELSLSFEVPDNNATRGATSETVISVGNNDVSNASLEVVGVAGNDIRLGEGANVTLRVTLDLAFDRATSIQIVIAGTATTDDYRINVDPVELPADSTYAERTLTIIDDDQVEPDETIILALDAGNNGQIIIGDESGVTLTIDDNDVPAISFERAEYTIFEGTTGTITLLADPRPLVKIQIRLTTLMETTISNDDYALSTTIITFESDQSTASFEVSIPAREDFQETRELHVSFELLDTENSTPGAVFETVINVEDDSAPIASLEVVGDDTLPEGGGSATLRVTLDRSFEQATSIQIVIAGGTATLGEDYRIVVNPVELSIGSTYVETTLEVIDDFQVEPDETIILMLAADNNRIIDNLPRAQLTLTIEDNDVPAAISFERDVYDISEGTIGTITLLADPSPKVKTQISLTALSETTVSDDKYRLSTTIITFEPGQSTASFVVEIIDDDVVQSTRTLSLSINPVDNNATRGATSETVIRVRDSDVSIASLGVVGDDIRLEEGANVTLRVTLDLAFDRETTIQIVATGDATPGDDYTINRNLLELPIGSTYVETILEVMDDGQVEPDETIVLTLEANNNEQIRDGAQLILTIEDNDVPAAISFERTEYTIFEGTTGTVTLVAEPPPGIKTQISLTTLSETTVSDEEYRLSTTIITFEPGQSTASFVVEIFDDDVVQSTRTLSLSINPVDNNATPGRVSVAVITVENDDTEISLTTPSAESSLIVTEGRDLSATLQLNINPPVDRVLSVNLSYTGDVGALTGALSSAGTPGMSTVIMVPANTATHNFDVTVEDDQIAAEGTRTATILLEESGSDYLVDTDNTTVEISVEDNDVARVSFSQNAGSVTEGNNIVFIITQDLITDIATSVNIAFTPTGDFFETTPLTTQVDFPAGVAMSTAMITIETVEDIDIEADGSLRANIMIIDGSPLQLGTPAERTVTILSDDVPAVISFERDVYTIFEGTTGTITLLADPRPLVKIQIRLTTLMETTISNDDYALSTTIITFESDQSTASFEVSIPAREDFQETRELHVSFELLDTENSTPGAVFETVINVEDDSAPIASLEVVGDDILLEEGDSVTLRVTLDRSFEQATSIRIVIEREGTATLGEDYRIVVNPVELPMGSTYVETTLEVIDDLQVESAETIILTLNAHNNRIVDQLRDRARLTLTIEDNDVPAAISFERDVYDISEGTTGTITLLADPSPKVKTQISLTADSATILNSEYSLSTTMIVFEPGQSTASFEVSIFDDSIVRSTRKLSLFINPVDNNAIRGTTSETVISVGNNDVSSASLEVVGVVGNNIRLAEGDNVTLRVTLDLAFDREMTIQIVATGDATPEDYTITVNPVELPAGRTYAETQLMIRVDDDQEPDETIILTLDAGNNLIIVDRPEARLTLTIGRVALLFRIKVFLEGAQ